jgi:nucleotidyltransferase substrate binding protein (TIGR01987 family)
MDRVNERLSVARTAMSALKEALGRKDLTTLERDGAIQRFEFTYEVVLKAVQEYLGEIEKVKVASPKGIVRASFEIGILNDEEARQMLLITDDRNTTVHTYNEKFAQSLYGRLEGHAQLMEKWLNEIQRRLE